MARSHQRRQVGRFVVLAAAVAWGLTSRPAAHEIPNEVTVHAFIRPAGDRLTLLVRAPLAAMRDMDVPMVGPGYVDLGRVDPVLRDAATLWIGDFVQVYENDTRLTPLPVRAARISLPSDRSFASFDQALAHITGGRLPLDTELYWQQGLLDVMFEYPIRSDRSEFAISPGLTRLGLRVNVVLRFLPPGGVERAFDVHGDPGIVRLDPRWHQAALHFVEEGFRHILDGIDHLLFLFCLVIPFRRLRPLVLIVTSFTVAHSVTLIASAYDMAPNVLWFPPLIETLIAVSIVYMAFENIVVGLRPSQGPPASGGGAIATELPGGKGGPSRDRRSKALERRWLITFGFGLVHGFGFSFALRETLQFAGAHVLSSLVAFNVGVELGQLLVLGLLIPALNLFFRYVVDERIGAILVSALMAHTAWHWAADRGGQLAQFPFPRFDLAMVASGMRLLMLVLIAGGLVWIVATLFGRPDAPRAGRQIATGGEK